MGVPPHGKPFQIFMMGGQFKVHDGGTPHHPPLCPSLEPAAIYWFNKILFVILNGLSGLHMASSDLQGQVIIRVASVSSNWFQWPLNDLRGQLIIKMA